MGIELILARFGEDGEEAEQSAAIKQLAKSVRTTLRRLKRPDIDGNNPRVTAPLREDRSKAGHVVVAFAVDRVQLDQSNLRLVVPHSGGGAKGVTYVLRVKDFVELEKNR